MALLTARVAADARLRGGGRRIVREDPIDLGLRETVMTASGGRRPNLPQTNPLFERRIADAHSPRGDPRREKRHL